MGNRKSILQYSKVQNHPTGVTHFNTIQTATIGSLQLENTKSLWNKLLKPEKVTLIVEDH